MLDGLLGRTELKERIEELREERDRLEERFEAERERRREAVRERQEAQERENRLEDRISDLEGRLERIDEESDLEFRGVETLRGERLREVLDRLDSFRTGEEGVLTAMVDGEVPAAGEAAFGERAPLLARAEPCLAVADDAGLVSVTLTPPLAPDPFWTWGDTVDLEYGWFLPEGEFAFALVRSDLFAMGEYRGTERESVRAFESDVKGDHSKGGFSQGRFERRRDNQVKAHLQKCGDALADRDADRLIVVGQRTLLKEFDADVTRAVDATGDPEDALESAFRDFFTARLYRL
ncbi:Vms1/Ankzf1 family peptidyl-tRNA hydrolase [Halalkalicoccus sp. NIPERK01]|uniref:Vms1/Ankzf1 family peptidyl-tRNA hydrolase n=1 Tax=Halalkalicoccus sp. NIPERK01 TaxID=3053469 RepID=UPI00256E9ADF|nr:Vms1/Ankzf1 family peptidyl-tRNA hydrolase [Halalkalicoccus sp. NIPERK01]MDL5362690.1 Vms1/Ankzf1 family peptidyl-tRNA hydrolase [Halalkalicoccus sp. NIPERK01]